MGDGQMALWKRKTVAGRRLAPERVLPYPGPALLSPEDKARTVFPCSWNRPTLPRQQLSTTWLGTPFCCAHRRPAIRSSLSSRCQVPTSQQGSSLAPSKEAEPGGAAAIESKGWDPGPVRKSWRSHSHRLEGHGGLATCSRPLGPPVPNTASCSPPPVKNPQKELDLSYSK